MLNNNLVSKLAIMDFQKFEVNLVSLSDTISLGIPCSMTISFMKMLAISIALQFDLTEMKWEYLLKFSTMTMMTSFFLVDFGNPVMKTMEMVSHFHYGIGRGCNSSVGCWCWCSSLPADILNI